MKIVDTMKYFQTSLAQVASTAIISKTWLFGKFWLALTGKVKEKIIEV